MSGKPEPFGAEGSLAPAVVPAARFRTTTSLPLPVSPGRRLFAVRTASKATTRPSALMLGRSVSPLACTPAAFTAASVVTPATRSRTTTSDVAPLASPGKRFVAWPDVNATRVPS